MPPSRTSMLPCTRAGVPLVVYNIHTLPGNDPEGILRVFLVVALLAPSLVFGNLLRTASMKACIPLSIWRRPWSIPSSSRQQLAGHVQLAPASGRTWDGDRPSRA